MLKVTQIGRMLARLRCISPPVCRTGPGVVHRRGAKRGGEGGWFWEDGGGAVGDGVGVFGWACPFKSLGVWFLFFFFVCRSLLSLDSGLVLVI